MRQRGEFPVIWTGKSPRALIALLALALLLPASALAAAPQTSVTDVEDEVMCPICGTLLELAESPQAQRERAFVRRLIAAGKTKAEVKDALVAQYGRGVLALPSGSGFDLSAYLVPVIAFATAAGALALGVRRWRGTGKPPKSGPGAPGGPQGEDAARLEGDLARYDL